MDARDINLEYAEDGETLEHAVLAGEGVMQLAGANGQPGRRIVGRGHRCHGGPRRRGHVAGRARQGRVVVARIEGRAQAGDSRREHERHRRAGQRPHRRAVQPQRRVPRGARAAHAARRAIADAFGRAWRQWRRRRGEVRGRHHLRGRRHEGGCARGQVSGGAGAAAAVWRGQDPAADGERRPHPGRGHDDRPDLRWAEDDCQGKRAERQPAGQEGRRRAARPTCRAC